MFAVKELPSRMAAPTLLALQRLRNSLDTSSPVGTYVHETLNPRFWLRENPKRDQKRFGCWRHIQMPIGQQVKDTENQQAAQSTW